ncbi:integrator complex subunit 10 isoform X1 [Labeo rohita]|uniref:Integrator complex subunit 10 n=1 Tax=Labeo rohita TaxID=84645 RepID=A0A498M9Y5_LABRO|nr:integrator complex subunit 10 isoform X1 [Labeo rohita]
MSAQGDCEFLVKRARELVPQDPYAAKAWLITARTLYPTDFNIQVSLGESLLEAETVESLDTPVNCFRKLFVCDVLPLILNNPEMRLPVSLLYKYMHKAAEFYICYVTREPSADGQIQAPAEPEPELALELLKSGDTAAIIQQASCHYALGEYRIACEKLLEVVGGLMPQNHEAVKSSEEQRKPRSKSRKDVKTS